MEHNEMRNLIEAEVSNPSEKQELLVWHKELLEYFQGQSPPDFRSQLKQKILEEANRKRRHRRWRGLAWSAGTIAAALFVLALINPSFWKLPEMGSLQQASDNAVFEPKNAASEKTESYQKTPEPTAFPLATAVTGTKSAVDASSETDRLEEQLKHKSYPAPVADQAGTLSVERVGFNGTGVTPGNRGVSKGLGGEDGSEDLTVEMSAVAQPTSAVIYQEKSREFTLQEALGIAQLFGFQAECKTRDTYRFVRNETQSSLTIDSGKVPTTINYHRGIVNPGKGMDVQKAIEKARGLVKQLGCLEGSFSDSVRVETHASISNSNAQECTLIFERWLNGGRLFERPITVTVDLGSGEIIGFNAAASTFEPQGSYPLIPPQEVSLSYGENLVQMELLMVSEKDPNGPGRLLVPHYLVVSRDIQGGLIETLVDAIAR